MDVSSPPGYQEAKPKGPGCLSDLGWFASGAVLPIGSLSFYRKATKRSVGQAILFFFAFTVLISILSTIALSISLLGAVRGIREAYDRGEVPEITIANGIAEVDGPEPFILVNDANSTGAIFVAIDTTGTITAIDQSRYNQGLLITRTELHVMNNDGRYQVLPLNQLNAMFQQDPLVINAETVSNAWRTISIVVVVLFLVWLFIWNSVVRLMFIAMIALILWGIGSMFHTQAGYGDFVIGGLFAIVPAVYLSHLLHRIGVSFPGLQTILLAIFWVLALVATLSQDKFFTLDNPPRLWTALIGVPMLVLLAVDLFITTPATTWKIALWAVALLSGAALVGLRLYFHIRDMQAAAPASPPPPPVG